MLKRLVSAKNGFDDGGDREAKSDGTAAGPAAVARGLVLETGNHNLSKGEGDKEKFVEAVEELMRLATLDVEYSDTR